MSDLVFTSYLTEPQVLDVLVHVLHAKDIRTQVKVEGYPRLRWDYSYTDVDETTVFVEFDGDLHYRDSFLMKRDQLKNSVAKERGARVVRIPYWLQLDEVTTPLLFGRGITRTLFPHGFISTKVMPASFCTAGLRRFESEVHSLPRPVRSAVFKSLLSQCAIHGEESVTFGLDMSVFNE